MNSLDRIDLFKKSTKYVFLGAVVLFIFLAVNTYKTEIKEEPIRADAATSNDFKIQRGCATSSAATLTITSSTNFTAPADNSSAFIRLVSTKSSGIGKMSGGGSQAPDTFSWYISDQDFSGGSITFTRGSSAATQGLCWEIIEYIGPTDGPNRIIVRDIDTLRYANNTDTQVSTTTSLTSTSSVVIFITGQNNINSTASRTTLGQNTSEWSGSSVVMKRGIGGSSGTNSISYALIDFVGSNWSVQRIEHSFSSAGVQENHTIADIGALSRAFSHTQFRRADYNDVTDGGAEMWLSSVTQASFRLESGAATSGKYGVMWIVSNSETATDAQMIVQHINGTRSAGSGDYDTWSQAIPTPVASILNTSIMGESSRSAGATTRFPSGWISLIASTTNSVQLYQSTNNYVQTYRFDVVEWPKSKPVDVTQKSYRFFNNLNSANVSTPLAAIDTPGILANSGDVFRLRMLLHVTSSIFTSGRTDFRLQFAKTDSDCDLNYSNLDFMNITTSTEIAFYNNTGVSDKSNLTTNANDPTSSTTVVAQTYNESNAFTNSTANININQNGLWDFALKDNGATPSANYCFRADFDYAENIAGNTSNNTDEIHHEVLWAATNAYGISPNGQHSYRVFAQNTIEETGGDRVSFDDDYGFQGVRDFHFRPDGKKLYIISDGGFYHYVYQFSLSTPWDLSTISKDAAEFRRPDNGYSFYSMEMSPNGDKLYLGYYVGSNTIYQYSMSNWDISTAVYDNKYLEFIGNGTPQGITFSNDGTRMYVPGGDYAVGSVASIFDSLRKWANSFLPRAYGFGGGGGAGGAQCALSTPWDLSTAVCDNTKYDSAGSENNLPAIIEELVIDPSHTQIRYLGSGSDENGEYGGIYYRNLAYSPLIAMNYTSIPQIQMAPTSTSFSGLIQKSYRWYGDENAKDPSSDQAIDSENTAISNLGTGRIRHLRIGISSPSGDFSANQRFKLQFQVSTTTGSWVDLGSGVNPAFSGYNYSCCTSGSNIATIKLSSSTIKQTYEESETTASTTNAITTGNVAEWDFAIKANTSAVSGATYYFRMIGSNGTALGTYEKYPAVTISSGGATALGELNSVIFDTGSSTGAQLNSFLWTGTQPDSNSSVKFQFAASTSTSPAGGWDSLYKGPDGTSATWYYSSGPSVQIILNPSYYKNQRYFRYKLRIETSSGVSPVVNQVKINWSP